MVIDVMCYLLISIGILYFFIILNNLGNLNEEWKLIKYGVFLIFVWSSIKALFIIYGKNIMIATMVKALSLIPIAYAVRSIERVVGKQWK